MHRRSAVECIAKILFFVGRTHVVICSNQSHHSSVFCAFQNENMEYVEGRGIKHEIQSFWLNRKNPSSPALSLYKNQYIAREERRGPPLHPPFRVDLPHSQNSIAKSIAFFNISAPPEMRRRRQRQQGPALFCRRRGAAAAAGPPSATAAGSPAGTRPGATAPPTSWRTTTTRWPPAPPRATAEASSGHRYREFLQLCDMGCQESFPLF